MKNTIKKLISEQIAQETDYIKEHTQIHELLIKVDGKPINGRTFNDKMLGGFKLKTIAGMYHINGKYSHLIGYSSDPFVRAQLFVDRFDTCHGTAAAKRIEQLKNLDVNEAAKVFGKIDKAFNQIREAFGEVENKGLDSYENPIYYDILREIQKGASEQYVKLSDFYFIRK